MAATTDKPQPEIEGIDESADGSVQKVLMPVQAGTFNVSVKPAKRIMGIVVAADTGKPLEGIKLYANSRPLAPYIYFLGPEALFAVSDSAGKFVFPDAPKSSYQITATPPDDSLYMGWNKSVDFPADKSELKLRIDLARGIPIDGRVVNKDTGKGIPGNEVLFRFKDKNAQSKPPAIEPRIRVETDNDGRFHLLVPPGKGTVMLCDLFVGGAWGFIGAGSSKPETEAELNSYTIHIMEPTAEKVTIYSKHYQEIDVKPGQRVPNVIFSKTPVKESESSAKQFEQDVGKGVLKIDGSEAGMSNYSGEAWETDTTSYSPPPKLLPEISGIVRDADGQPVAGAVVGLRDWFRMDKIYARRFVRSDSSGRFTLRAIPLIPRQAVKAVQNQRQLAGVTPVPENMQEGTGEPPLEIRLSATGSVVGMLQKEGKPLGGVKVACYQGPPDFVRRDNPHATDVAMTDSEGRFQFPFLPAGKELTFSVFSHNLFTEKPVRKVVVKPGETSELEPFNFLSTNGSLAGTIVDPEGKPVAGAFIEIWPKDNPPKHNEINSLQTAHVEPQITGKDGRFTINGLPSIPLTLEVCVFSKDYQSELYERKRVPVEPGQKELRIEIVPKK